MRTHEVNCSIILAAQQRRLDTLEADGHEIPNTAMEHELAHTFHVAYRNDQPTCVHELLKHWDRDKEVLVTERHHSRSQGLDCALHAALLLTAPVSSQLSSSGLREELRS